MDKEAYFKSIGEAIGRAGEFFARSMPGQAISRSGEAFKKLLIGKGGDPLSKLEAARVVIPVAGAAIGAQAIGKGVEKYQQHQRQEEAFEELMKDPDISGAEPAKAMALFNTLKEYAPSIAKDPLISQAFVKGMLQYGTVDHNVVKDLMTAEKIHKELKGQPFTAIEAIKGVSWLA